MSGKRFLTTEDTPAASTAPVWNKKGIVLAPTLSTDEDTLQEATVIYEGSPKILTNTVGSVFKLWFTQGYGTPAICYAESLDGVKWVRRSTPALTGYARSTVIKVSNTYVLYASLFTTGAQIDRYTSTDGLTWTLANAAVITKGSGGAWNSASLANMSVFYDADDSTYKMILEGNSAANNGVFSLGYYTSPDGITWTPYASNPVVSIGTRTWGGAYVTKINGVFWMWCHGGTTFAQGLPTDLYRFHSTDMINWTMAPAGPCLARSAADEGVGTSVGQIADPTLLEVNGKTYMWYSAGPNGAAQSGSHLKLAIADKTMAELVTTDEGDNNNLLPAQVDAYDKAQADARYLKPGTTWQDGPLYLQSEFDGIRIRIGSQPNYSGILYPGNLQFNAPGSILNNISAGAGGFIFQAHGGFQVNNNTGTGVSLLLDLDYSAGLATVHALNISDTPGDDSGSAFHLLGRSDSNGGILKTSFTTMSRTCAANKNSVTVANTVTETSIIPNSLLGSMNVYNYVQVATKYMLKIAGVYSTPAGSSALTIKLLYAGLTIATCTLSALAASATNLPDDAVSHCAVTSIIVG